MDLVPEKKHNPGIKRVIGITSGKGGVGKSTVAVLLAQSLASRGLKVGVLDADLTGPSLPRLLGIDTFRAESDGKRLYPVINEEGIKVLSINLFSEHEDEPVIWRGPPPRQGAGAVLGRHRVGRSGLSHCRFPAGYLRHSADRVPDHTVRRHHRRRHTTGLRFDNRHQVDQDGDDAQRADHRPR
jgi:hypothetical protein